MLGASGNPTWMTVAKYSTGNQKADSFTFTQWQGLGFDVNSKMFYNDEADDLLD